MGKITGMKFRWNRVPYYISVVLKLWGRVNLAKNEVIVNGLRLKFAQIGDLLEIKEVVLDREYENEKVGLEDSDKIVVDVGAGVGDFAIMAAMRLPKAKILAFEPDEQRRLFLLANIGLNGVKNVTVVDQPALSLKQIVRGGKTVDFLKVDCEGCEYRIFGNQQWRYLNKIRKIAMELHLNRGNDQQLIERLINAGWKVETSLNRGVLELRHVYAKKE
ncbi:hypothetical protein A2899_04090 [Candidatus Amesbacteria bacterium RIFCSPLOWO2_01_FULL_49_25]|uniref:Methyltransferase FkbM domain-containing protein n=1 Tax=Candidatus Amesbacteria bacterium RIFCSPHIGHO2_01_FULL_48_32b TaxID=1797253 RepID=A0A1F4YGM0_9BACT|nr:MAG: hypothetical protein A2876_00745 [Candidatus Amesbacteria bacterium RIFCSPHIGHO2_01_FULL_48_32b]OGD07455.1 MAG: hypothetical protein A2899_04090 [Candidatus Amesbacteria bacterium RIFCSPLOWO2_01_FULL_49_25]